MLLLFDMDGTLAESGQQIAPDMIKLLEECKKGNEIGIVGGGRYEKILWQLNGLKVDHIFSESGSVYHTDYLIYKHSLRNHTLYYGIQVLIKLALQYLATVDYPLTGHFIDIRNGLVYISLIGLQATDQERAEFIQKDEVKGYRQTLLTQLRSYKEEKGWKIEVTEGGSVGIAVFPEEWDKVQVLTQLPEQEIHYFGDKFTPTGNDYKLLNHPRVIGHPVTSVAMCMNEIQKLLGY